MDASPELTVRRVSLDQLHLDPANARRHDDTNLSAIADSLARFGQQKPIVVDQRGRILAGNGTFEAAKHLGWTDIFVVESSLEAIEATAYAIADNRTTDLSEFDEPVLARLLSELREEDALDGVGFSDADIDELLAELEGDSPIDLDDPGPEDLTDDTASQAGDLWILGDHRLLCGDSTSADDVARLLGDDVPALMATDPPYCVRYSGADRPQDSGKDWTDRYHEVDIEDLGEFLRSVFGAVLPRLAPDAGIYVWHAHLQYPVIHAVFEEFGLLPHQAIIWQKPSSTFTYSYYRWAHEPCLFGWKKGHKPPHNLENGLTSVWEADWEGKARVVGNEHPTQKPLRLFEIPMEQHTRPGAVVFEPFSGSGTQLLAAEKLRRCCRAMEVSPPFVDVAIRRWQTATGRDAVLEGDGRTFAEISAERLTDSEEPSA